MPKLLEVSRLQEIADKKKSSAITRAADHFYSFDTEDPYECQKLMEEGVEAGMRLYRLALRSVRKNPTQVTGIFKVTFGEYGDDDGTAYFVGTEDAVAERLSALKNSDEFDGEEDDE